MREIKKNNKKSVLKKIFIKISRLFGYEIIDQNNFNGKKIFLSSVKINSTRLIDNIEF